MIKEVFASLIFSFLILGLSPTFADNTNIIQNTHLWSDEVAGLLQTLGLNFVEHINFLGDLNLNGHNLIANSIFANNITSVTFTNLMVNNVSEANNSQYLRGHYPIQNVDILSLSWSKLTDFPAGCSGFNEFLVSVGLSNTCKTAVIYNQTYENQGNSSEQIRNAVNNSGFYNISIPIQNYTFNYTYDQFAYNQTAPAIQYGNQQFYNKTDANSVFYNQSNPKNYTNVSQVLTEANNIYYNQTNSKNYINFTNPDWYIWNTNSSFIFLNDTYTGLKPLFVNHLSIFANQLNSTFNGINYFIGSLNITNSISANKATFDQTNSSDETAIKFYTNTTANGVTPSVRLVNPQSFGLLSNLTISSNQTSMTANFDPTRTLKAEIFVNFTNATSRPQIRFNNDSQNSYSIERLVANSITTETQINNITTLGVSPLSAPSFIIMTIENRISSDYFAHWVGTVGRANLATAPVVISGSAQYRNTTGIQPIKSISVSCQAVNVTPSSCQIGFGSYIKVYGENT